MNRIVLGCSGIALAVGLSACDTNFKATDKLMRNQHRVVQNTRVYQEPTVQRQVVQQVAPVVQRVQPIVQQVAPIIQQVQPVLEPVETTIVEQEPLPVKPLEPKIVTREVKLPPIYKTVYIDAPAAEPVIKTVVRSSQRINIRTLTVTQIRTLQSSLASKGLYRAPVDGIFGIKTAQALAAYQRQAGTSGPVTITILEALGISL